MITNLSSPVGFDDLSKYLGHEEDFGEEDPPRAPERM